MLQKNCFPRIATQVGKLGNVCIGSKLRIVVGRNLGQSLHASNTLEDVSIKIATLTSRKRKIAVLCVAVVWRTRMKRELGKKKKARQRMDKAKETERGLLKYF